MCTSQIPLGDEPAPHQSYHTSYSQKMDPDALDTLNFTGFIEQFGLDKLDQLYPKNPRFGQLNPAPSYLVSGKKVKEWREISKGNE